MAQSAIAAQLYTVCEFLKTPTDVAKSFKKIRAIGYEAVQASGLGPIEMALVVMILFLLTFGAIQYGWLFLKAQQITHTAREAARRGCAYGATDAEVIASITATMTDAGMASMIKYVSYDNTATTPVGDPYTVSVSIPASANLALINNAPFLPVPAFLGASVSMMKEGP